ncbi:MAG: hypothetical protein PVG90_12725 [Bacillota bacterium]
MKDRTETKRGQVGIVGFPVNEVGPEEVMFLTVPGPNIKRLALFGVVSGLGIGIFLILIMQNWLGLWTYHQIDFIYLFRSITITPFVCLDTGRDPLCPFFKPVSTALTSAPLNFFHTGRGCGHPFYPNPEPHVNL